MAVQTILVCWENCPVPWIPWFSDSEKLFGKPVVELSIGFSFVSLAEDGGNRRDICCSSRFCESTELQPNARRNLWRMLEREAVLTTMRTVGRHAAMTASPASIVAQYTTVELATFWKLVSRDFFISREEKRTVNIGLFRDSIHYLDQNDDF